MSDDDLNAARGIVYACLASVALWAAILFICKLASH